MATNAQRAEVVAMLNVGQASFRNCQGVTRRELLQVGGLGLHGLTLADGIRAEPAPRRTEPACILIFLEGGPSQLETFDPKPNSPNDVRGPYGTIASSVPGTQIGE